MTVAVRRLSVIVGSVVVIGGFGGHQFRPFKDPEIVGPFIEGLQPTVKVGKLALCADVPSLASFPSRLLKNPVARIETERHELVAALDYLISGF